MEWLDKSIRDTCMEKLVRGPRMDAATYIPSDGRRMIFRSFTPLVSLPD
ncbi:MAG TPA: hypothetical protein VME63_08825 [Dyella sp.]|nr:hypothetical protein [Dyella sp.]HTV85497.1 hypothetical protein [Dyella sp.]